MKIVLRIFGIIAILVALVMGGLSIVRSLNDREEVAQAETQMAEAQKQVSSLKEMAKGMTGESKVQIDAQIATAEGQLSAIPSPSTYLIITVLLAALVLSAIVFGVLLFRSNLDLATKLLTVSVVLLLAAYFLSPDIARGQYGGFENRTLALVTGFPVIMAGLFAFGIAKKNGIKESSY